jgi:predicted nucleic acid-binding protein
MREKRLTKIGTIGADTSFLIDFFKGDVAAVEFMRQHVRLLRVSELVIYEFLCGNLSERDEKIFIDAVQFFTALEFNREAAILGSQMYRKGKEEGKTVGHQDCMIAGSYLSHGVHKIVTRNTGHFGREVDVIKY